MGPSQLVLLLRAPDAAQSDNAWDAFLLSYGNLLLRTAQYTHRDHDAAMDAYAYVLEHLRQDDFKRLRAFDGDGEDSLLRWLVVVARIGKQSMNSPDWRRCLPGPGCGPGKPPAGP